MRSRTVLGSPDVKVLSTKVIFLTRRFRSSYAYVLAKQRGGGFLQMLESTNITWEACLV
jgi:hypothetical protein